MIDEKELWERLKRRRASNIENMEEVYFHVNMGINQAIGILNSMPKASCGTCKWHEDFSGACFNADSPYAADFTNQEALCAAWEIKESEDKKE